MAKAAILIIAAATLLPNFLISSDTPSQKEAIAQLESAISKTNIFELPSFVMRADIEIENNGKSFSGKYLLLWNGPQQWREEISLPGYHEIQVGGKGVISVFRNADFAPLGVYNLHRALGFGGAMQGIERPSFVQIGLGMKDVLKKTREHKEHGEKIRCFAFEDAQNKTSERCQNPTSGFIDRGVDYSDSDFQPLGGKMFPRVMSIKQDGKTVAKANITSLTLSPDFPLNIFTPPDKASQQPGCMNPDPPRLVKKVSPQYPQAAREARVEGSVMTIVSIGTDGVPKIVKVVESANRDLESASLSAIREWRYEPAMCGGQAVPQETVLQINYTLSSH